MIKESNYNKLAVKFSFPGLITTWVYFSTLRNILVTRRIVGRTGLHIKSLYIYASVVRS